MLGKVDATLFLDEPNRVFGEEREFALHRLTTKYYRIYRFQAKQKGVDLRVSGESYGSVRYNPAAIGAVIHTLLDNCIKYAPSASRADILFSEDSQSITVTFESLGPRIEPDERKKIFLPGFRATAARESESSGLGFGLSVAKSISDALRLGLTVSQDAAESKQFTRYHKTSFAVRLQKEDSEAFARSRRTGSGQSGRSQGGHR